MKHWSGGYADYSEYPELPGSWIYDGPATVTVGSDKYFVAEVVATSVPTTIVPTGVYLTIDSVVYPCLFAPTSGQTSKGITIPQTTTFSAAANTPTNMPIINPNGTYTDLGVALGSTAYPATDNVKWDAKTKQWVVVLHRKEGTVWVSQVGTYDSKGKQISLTPKKGDPTSNGANYKAAQKSLLTAVQDGLNLDTTQSQPALPDTKAGTFNPPNHFFTRRPSFTDVVNATGNANLAGQISGHHALGRIVQDKSSSKLLNVKMGKNPAPKDVFGFRFSYNPTTIRYDTSANAPIDWTLGTADTANILGGPTIVNFDLYLNRIADVAELSSGYKQSNYVSPLSDPDKLGLRTRGTEYDLEFLYRVVNGTPTSTDLTLDTQPTSDFGYITGVPFWLYIHDNMRYFGGLAALSVNHVMFSTDMVPIFTVVSLTFNRYPVFDKTGYVGKQQSTAYQASQAGKTTSTTTP